MNTDQRLDSEGHQACKASQAWTAEAAEPPIDVDVLFSRCMSNASFALALMGELESNGKQQVEAIALHITRDQPLPAAEAAHALKGAAAIIGAERLRAKAAQIEETGRAGKTTQLNAMARDLECELDRCLSFIPVLKADLQQR